MKDMIVLMNMPWREINSVGGKKKKKERKRMIRLGLEPRRIAPPGNLLR
jgi:hypothetical protein